MLRSTALAALLILAAASTLAFADGYPNDVTRATPQPLQGGVAQDQTPDFGAAEAQLAQDQQWEADARALAQQQAEVQSNTFMSDPLCFRVTSVGEILKPAGSQKITAMPIHSVTISADGSVNLGDIVDGSGDGFYVPPNSLKKGDLFTQVGNQFVKVPANHFDAMGSLADQVNKQAPPDSPTALNNLANGLANATDAYKNNAASFANDFLLAAGNVMGSTIQFLAQQRGDFGQPGKPLQQILDYLNNDRNENQAQLGQAAAQAIQTLATHPGTVAGNLFMSMLPAGQLGKDAEVTQLANATQRLTAVENTATEFTTLERNLPLPKNDLEGLNLQQATQRIYPNGNPPPPVIQPSPNAVRQFPPEWGGPSAVAPPAQPLPAAAPEPLVPPGGDTAPVRTASPVQSRDLPPPVLPNRPTSPIPRGSPLQSRNIPTTPKAIPMTPAQRQALQDNLKKLLPALQQDATWAGADAPLTTPSSGDIINTLANRFGNSPKDPLQGAPGLLDASFGIPAPATAGSVLNALQLAGNNSRGLLFSQNPDNSLTILNARNNNGTIEFLDPATEKRAQPPTDSPLYFYRTN